MEQAEKRKEETPTAFPIVKIKYEKKTKRLVIELDKPETEDRIKTMKARLMEELGFLNAVEVKEAPTERTPMEALHDFKTSYADHFPYLKGVVSQIDIHETGERSADMAIRLRTDNEITRGRIKDILTHRIPSVAIRFAFEDSGCRENPLSEALKESEIREAVANGRSMVSRGVAENRASYKIRGKAVSIDEALSREESTVIVEGVFVLREEKLLKSGKTLEIIHLTDHNNTLAVKRFLEQGDKGIGDPGCGNLLRVKGYMRYDKFEKENILFAQALERLPVPAARMDDAPEKRIEFHCHTNMSSMDGVSSPEALIKRASEWGHEALAITDHGVVQAFPDACKYGKKYGIKILYGMEGYLVDDDVKIMVDNPLNARMSADGSFVVFDIETTGLSFSHDRITEVGAVKVENGKITDTLQLLINPGRPIPPRIQELTGITDEMVASEPEFEHHAETIRRFFGDAAIVAHNAGFDMTFLKAALGQSAMELTAPVLDTVAFSKLVFPSLHRHTLKALCNHCGIKLEQHHRALDDAKATAELFLILLQRYGKDALDDLNADAAKRINFKQLNTFHVTLIARNQTGLRNLYELVSMSHIDHFYKKPRIVKSELKRRREGLLIGTACESGELYRAVLQQKSDEDLSKLVSFYDYVEIQPLENNAFLIEKGVVSGKEDLMTINKKLIRLAASNGKPAIATGDVHYTDPEEALHREILMSGQGFSDSDRQPPLHLKTTSEMLEAFSYLGKEKAYELVVENPTRLNRMIETVVPIPQETFAPEIEGSEEKLRELCYSKAKRLYGEPLPALLEKRLERELKSIIGNGYAVMYIIAHKLVSNSLKDGYLVGSRGSVGSSLAATMSDITEVNPLPPHYRCDRCRYSEFITDGSYGSGVDLPEKACPHCGEKLMKDGQDIPFEVFLGFEGDKEPDIDLNFAGEYQPVAHKYTEVLFGKGKVFRAGTIGTIATKTAYGFVRKFMEERQRHVTKYEINRLTAGCTGVKRTTGQHPGGIMVVPHYKDIHEFTPIQKPANDRTTEIITTHFDYHAISGRLLKLDILGHDAPSTIKFLEELTGVDPQTIPLDDPLTMSLFTGTEALALKSDAQAFETGSLGIPEFGTKFVRQMLLDTKPTTFSELVRISGLSHGTDVWINNAQDLVRSGTAELKEVISTRDDIMNYLIQKGLPNKRAFKIMENVRKGRGLSPEDMELMGRHEVPDWYVDSCNKIKYMFPKAHAAAYVMMSYRIAFFKVHHPLAFYASYFSNKVDDFDVELVCRGAAAIKSRLELLKKTFNELKQKEKDQMTVLEVAYEMVCRGYAFERINIYSSDPKRFTLSGDSLVCPLRSLPGLGESAAMKLADERIKGPFLSLEDLRNRTGISKKIVEKLRQNDCMESLPQTNQLEIFDLH